MNRKTDHEMKELLVHDLNEGNNFIDYFLVIGISPSIAFQDSLYKTKYEDLNNIFQDKLTPSILSQFPPIEKKKIGLDEGIIYHCFPKGFKVEEFKTIPQPEIFSILLDNTNYSNSIAFKYKYVTCLKFYESLANYQKLYIKRKKAKFLERNSEHSPSKRSTNLSQLPSRDVPSDFLNLTLNKGEHSPLPFHHPYFNDEENHSFSTFAQAQRFSTSTSLLKSNSLTGLPIFNDSNIEVDDNDTQNQKIQKEFLKDEIKEHFKLETNPDFFYESTEDLLFSSRISRGVTVYNPKELKLRKYYVPKCICLVSLYPFINEQFKILKSIYKHSQTAKQNSPIEKIIENLTIEVPVPPRGIYTVDYKIINQKITISQNKQNELPLLRFEFELLFKKFQLDDILTIFKYAMLNYRIVFFSSEIGTLTPVIMTILTLLFPFHYPFNVISIIPKEQSQIIDNVSAVIIGLNEKYYPNFFNDQGVDIPDNVLVVDLDSKKLDYKYAPGKNSDNSKVPNLPVKATKKLEGEMGSFFDELKMKPKGQKEGHTSFQMKIRNIFLTFQVRIMKKYMKYLNPDIYNHQTSQMAFKREDFLSDVSRCDLEFYKKFTETQMFNDFVYKRMTPQESKEILEILFFDEKIFEYKNRKKNNENKEKTVFLSSKDYEVTKTYSVPAPKKLSKIEYTYFMDEKVRKQVLEKFGVIITSPPKEPEDLCKTVDYNPNKNQFTYHIFPVLNSEFFFKTNIRNYFKFENLNNEIDHINLDLLSKSHLNSLEIKNNEMENYIYLIWLKLWAFSFWYHDTKERKYRFNEMIVVLDKVKNREIELFNLLFKSLTDCNVEDDFILELYNKIITYNVSLSTYVFDSIKHILRNIERKKKSSNDGNFKTEYGTNYEEKPKFFRERTFKSNFDTFVSQNKLKFYMKKHCMECKQNIYLGDLINDINNGSRELLWAKCKQCNAEFLPELTIRFGCEMNKLNDCTLNTSVIDDVPLYSPYTLYYTMINSIVKDNKIEIDSLRKNCVALFWNFIWYFKALNLPYECFCPYKANVSPYSHLLNNYVKNQNFETTYYIDISQAKNDDIKKQIEQTTKIFCKKFEDFSLEEVKVISFELLGNVNSDSEYSESALSMDIDRGQDDDENSENHREEGFIDNPEGQDSIENISVLTDNYGQLGNENE